MPKPVKVVWSNDSFVYDGKAHTPTATADPDDVIEGDTVDISVGIDGGEAIEPGEYTAEAASENPNYVPSDATRTHLFRISDV